MVLCPMADISDNWLIYLTGVGRASLVLVTDLRPNRDKWQISWDQRDWLKCPGFECKLGSKLP